MKKDGILQGIHRVYRGTPYYVRSSIKYSVGYSILCKKRNETINIRKTMYLNDLHTFLLFLRQYKKMRKLLVPPNEIIYIGRMLSSSRISRKGFPV